MDDQLQEESRLIRKLDSGEAVVWLINKYPVQSINSGSAITLLRHRSWKKSDQIALARHYLQNIPHASDRAYTAFLSFMSVPNFIRVIEEVLPSNNNSLDLLIYYLGPALHTKATTQADKKLVSEFINKLQKKILD